MCPKCENEYDGADHHPTIFDDPEVTSESGDASEPVKHGKNSHGMLKKLADKRSLEGKMATPKTEA